MRVGCQGFLFIPPENRKNPAMLLRKEVIQPLLPQRLPCYDFIPLALHTVVSSLPYGLGHRLQVQTTRVM